MNRTEISLDKLPIKRLDAIEENGLEIFPCDIGYDEKRVSQIRRLDFAWAVDKDTNKKQKKEISMQPLQWQHVIENLHLAHQELSVIIDLINTVEANDTVTVASMTRPKQLPNELLSDLAISTSTKLYCFQNLSKYFKQSAKALEQQLSRESRFYGALIRLQKNWKVKRQRIMASSTGGEGFFIDLFDNSVFDPAAVFRPPFISVVRIERNSAGMLDICIPPNSRRCLHFGFRSSDNIKESNEIDKSLNDYSDKAREEVLTDDVSIKQTHSILHEVYRTIFDEQVFGLVNREASNPCLGVNVTGIQENLLQLSIGQGDSAFISLIPSGKDNQTADIADAQKSEIDVSLSDTFDMAKHDDLDQKTEFPHRITYEIYLQQIFHKRVFVKAKGRPVVPGRNQLGLLGHFCMSLAHRIFASKVLVELENLVCNVAYLNLISHPTWHSRTSSWTLATKVPQFTGGQTRSANVNHVKNTKSQFRTTVSVSDDCINIQGECSPNAVGMFRSCSEEACFMNCYNCDLTDLPVILLQQFASQVIKWLHEEALMVGLKANRDFLCLCFEVDDGETLTLVAHVDPEDGLGCISWWLVMEGKFSEDSKLCTSQHRKFLGHLPLDVLYTTVMDLVGLCNGGASI